MAETQYNHEEVKKIIPDKFKQKYSDLSFHPESDLWNCLVEWINSLEAENMFLTHDKCDLEDKLKYYESDKNV